MELVSFTLPKSTSRLTIAAVGDIQWSGDKGPTAQDSLKRYIDKTMALEAFYVGTGDYIDFLSPSNRRRLSQADLYDTARMAMWDKAQELTETVYEKFLKGTEGRWLGKVEGHHFFEAGDQHTDEILANKLKTKFLGTSAIINIPAADFKLWLHHGQGGAGVLPAAALNRLYHTSAGMHGADLYMMGHCTRLAAARLSRPFPVWGKKNGDHYLKHHDVHILSCGGFSKSNIVGSCSLCNRPRGDYAEQAMLTPSPLTGPIITVEIGESWPDRVRVAI